MVGRLLVKDREECQCDKLLREKEGTKVRLWERERERERERGRVAGVVLLMPRKRKSGGCWWLCCNIFHIVLLFYSLCPSLFASISSPFIDAGGNHCM